MTVLPFDHALGLPDALRPPDRPQHLDDPDRGVASGPGHRPGGRLLVRGAAHRRARRRPPGPGSRRSSGPAARRPRCAPGWSPSGSAPPGQRRSENLARRREPVTGVSEFPNLAEAPVERDPRPRRPAGGLPRVRRDEAFEALRARSDAHLAATGARPRVFLAALGPAAAHTARASLRRQPLPGGRHRAGPRPGVGRRGLGRRGVHRAAGRRWRACAPATRSTPSRPGRWPRRCKAAGALRVFLAGRPGEQRETYVRAGVDEFVFAGCDAVAVLTSALDHGSGVMRTVHGHAIPGLLGHRASGPATPARRRVRGPVAAAAVKESTGKGDGDLVWETPEGIAVKPLYTAADLDGLDFLGTYPGHRAVSARPVPDDVRQPAVDDPSVRRVLHRRGVQRLLPAQPRRRAEGPVGRLRPADPPRLRQRPSAGDRRRRHGRRGHRLDLRHAAALRRHPAGPDERVDDDERRGAAGARAVHRGRRGAGRTAREAGRDHPERHPQGVHGPQHLHLSAAALDADHLRHLRLHLAEDAALQLHLHLRLPHPGGRGDGRPGAGLHPRRRRGVSAGRARTRASTWTPSRRGCRSSGRSA